MMKSPKKQAKKGPVLFQRRIGATNPKIPRIIGEIIIKKKQRP